MTTQLSNTNIQFEEVYSREQAMKMRDIRNQVAPFMTHNNQEISIEQQLLWFATKYRPARRHKEMVAYLIKEEDLSEVSQGIISYDYIGYGLIQTKDNRKWLTGGLIESARGKGYGQKLFEFLRDEVGKPVYLDVRNTNTHAYELYKKIGFKDIVEESNDFLTVMVHD